MRFLLPVSYSDIERYDEKKTFQTHKDLLAESMLIGQQMQLDIVEIPTSSFFHGDLVFNFIHDHGVVVAGSAIARSFDAQLKVNDVDIYFSNMNSLISFCTNNNIFLYATEIETLKKKSCIHKLSNGHSVNLIMSDFKTPHDIISRFDIRAISLAWSPVTTKIYAVRGAPEDIRAKRIVFNPFPKHTSVTRLIKYINKGFSIDRYQTALFTELIKNPSIHNLALEFTTGSYGSNKENEEEIF